METRLMGRSPPTTTTDGGRTGAGPPLPSGVVALRKYADRDGYYLSLTEEVHDLTALDAGEYVHLDYNDDLGVVSATHVESPSDHDPATSMDKKLIDNQGAIRLTMPRSLLNYDLGIDVDAYPETDPFLFRFEVDAELPVGERDYFALAPLGHASDVFQNPATVEDEAATTTPIPHEHVRDYADEFDLSARRVTDALDALAAHVDDRTFDALGADEVAPPTLVTVDGQEVAIHYLTPGTFGLIGDLFDFEGAIVTAAFRLHHEFGAQLIEEVFAADNEPVPDDHPLRDPDVEAMVLPLGGEEEQVDAEGGPDRGGVRRRRLPPVTPDVIAQTAATSGVDRDALQEALEEATAELTSSGEPFQDAVDADIVDRRNDPETVPFDWPHEHDADYEHVRIEFVGKGDSTDLLTTIVGVDQDVAEAATVAWNRQAEHLLRDADVAPSLRRFRREADAVLIPTGVAPDGGTT